VFVPAVGWGQLPADPGSSAFTAAVGVGWASTGLGGPAYGLGYHRLLRPRVVAGALLLYHAIDHPGADYSPIWSCSRSKQCVVQRPGANLASLLLAIELYPDPARVGPFGSIGVGASYYGRAPDKGSRLVPVLAGAAGFDLPISVARLRLEARYMRLVGVGAGAVDIGAAMVALVLPGCLTRVCS